MAKVLDPTTVANRWAQNLAGASQKIAQGVAAVTESPGAKAAQAADLWQTRVSSADAKSRFATNTAKVSLTDWKQAMTNKGIPRISQGANDAKPKMTNFLQQFLPFVQNVADSVHQMPKNTLDDRINRAVAQIRGTAQFRKQ